MPARGSNGMDRFYISLSSGSGFRVIELYRYMIRMEGSGLRIWDVGLTGFGLLWILGRGSIEGLSTTLQMLVRCCYTAPTIAAACCPEC